jgi:trypsin
LQDCSPYLGRWPWDEVGVFGNDDIMMSSSWLSKLLLLLASILSGISSADNNNVVHRLRTPHVDAQGVITTRDDYGNNLVEVVASSKHQEEHEASFRPQQTRIVNGTAPDKGDAAYPFFVELQFAGGWNLCGGQLIAPNVVLTAAHCVYDKKDYIPPEMVIWNGSEMEKRIPESGVIHPKYNKTQTDDLALIKLKEPALPVNEVNDGNGAYYWELVADDYDWINHPPIIRLQRYQTPSGCTSLYSQGLAEDILTLTVIGRQSDGGRQILEADVHYVLNSVCNEQYSGIISDDMVCAADTVEKQDACRGDSGGPLFTRLPVGENSLFTLVGVISWGYGCANPEYPGVYSRVAKITEWIDDTVCGYLSPKSCTADGKIRDYAVEALAVGTSMSRQMMKNRVKYDRRADLYGEQLEEELCELLGSDVNEEIPSLSPSSTPSELQTLSPSSAPSELPTRTFSSAPSELPSLTPSSTPSSTPSQPPTRTHLPSSAPSKLSARTFSSAPSQQLPTFTPSSAPPEPPTLPLIILSFLLVVYHCMY